MAALLTNPAFSTRSLLTIRSPQFYTLKTVDIAYNLAILGHVSWAVEIAELGNLYTPIELRYFYTSGLHYAFDAAKVWPNFVPEEARHEESLKRLDDEQRLTSWGHIFPMWEGMSKPKLPLDEDSLKRLLAFIDQPDPAAKYQSFDFEYDQTRYMKLERDDVVCAAIDMALRIGHHEADIDRLMDNVKNDISKFGKRIGQSRPAWKLLTDGSLMPNDLTEKEQIEREFQRIKSTLQERNRTGLKHPFRDMSTQELLEILDRNTVNHDLEYGGGDQITMEEVEKRSRYVNGQRTILHLPAAESTISALESRLKLKLPEDYKGFLRTSDGLEGVWNGWYLTRCLTSSSLVHEGEDIFGSSDDTLGFGMIDWTELPREKGFFLDWPDMHSNQVVQINEHEDLEQVWLVKPTLVKQCVGFFLGRYNNEKDEDVRKVVERAADDFFGGIGKLKDLAEAKGEGEGWAVAAWDASGNPMEVWGSFREYLESLVLDSENN